MANVNIVLFVKRTISTGALFSLKERSGFGISFFGNMVDYLSKQFTTCFNTLVGGVSVA